MGQDLVLLVLVRRQRKLSRERLKQRQQIMTDQKKPEAIAEDDLDAVQGAGAKDGHDSYANLETNFVRDPRKKDGIIWMDSGEGAGIRDEEKAVRKGASPNGI